MKLYIKFFCTFLIAYVIAFIVISIFWQWLEFIQYGKTMPSTEDDIMGVIMAWMIATRVVKVRGAKWVD